MGSTSELEGVISIGAWGSRSGGDSWSYKPNTSSPIREILFHEGGNIKSIFFRHQDRFISGAFGGRDPRDRGTERRITLRTPSEYLKSISGTYGLYNRAADVILSLSFHTNLSTYGPFGRPSGSNPGTPFTIPMEDSVLVGFHGRAGFYLDAIGIYVKPLNPRGSISLGTWGGPEGDPFGFVVGTTSWIKQIIVRHDSNIKALSFKDGNDHNYGIFGGKNPNDLGRETIIEFDGRSEFLTSISGTNGSYVNYASVITSLLFETNLNTYGPFGREIGTTFSLPIMRGAVVVGFHGKSNIYIDSIGIYVRPRTVG
ncbi:hypothetical protein CsatA_017520 [Cannabis sativa]